MGVNQTEHFQGLLAAQELAAALQQFPNLKKFSGHKYVQDISVKSKSSSLNLLTLIWKSLQFADHLENYKNEMSQTVRNTYIINFFVLLKPHRVRILLDDVRGV